MVNNTNNNNISKRWCFIYTYIHIPVDRDFIQGQSQEERHKNLNWNPAEKFVRPEVLS